MGDGQYATWETLLCFIRQRCSSQHCSTSLQVSRNIRRLTCLVHLPTGQDAYFKIVTFFILLFQNLNSDFTDSALGSKDKSPLPYGNFQLRESTMQSILNNPKYGPRSELGINMYTYLKFGLPRVMPFGMDEVRIK